MSRYAFILNSFGLQAVKPLLFDEIQYNAPDDPVGQSQLNTPIWDNIVLQDKKESPGTQVRIDTVLIDASQAKLIEETVVSGREGTVKEYITLLDWNITLRGVLTHETHNTYPREDFNSLLSLCKMKREIYAVCNFLQMLGVYNLVIREHKFPQREGFQYQQLFQLKCVSDIPLELVVNEDIDE